MKLLRTSLYTLGAVGCVVALSPVLFFFWTIGSLPESKLRAPSSLAPDAAIELSRSAYWGWLDLNEDIRVDPYRRVVRILAELSTGPTLQDGGGLADDVARIVFADELGTRRSIWVRAQRSSVAIWIGRNWSSREAISALLAAVGFGHGFRGLGAAARGYFGKTAESLNTHELAYLIVSMQGFSLGDPWCTPQRVSTRATALLARLSAEDAGLPVTLLSPPPEACRG